MSINNQTPEEIRTELFYSNFWAETALNGKFFFVDGAFAIILLMSTINIFNTTTLSILGGSFIFFAVLAKLDLSIGEFVYKVVRILCKKKYRRY